MLEDGHVWVCGGLVCACMHVHTHLTHTVASRNEDGLRSIYFQIIISFNILRRLDFGFIFCMWVNSIFPSVETHKGRLLPLHRQLRVWLAFNS